jgi:hypothetical protein
MSTIIDSLAIFGQRGALKIPSLKIWGTDLKFIFERYELFDRFSQQSAPLQKIIYIGSSKMSYRSFIFY